MQTLSLPQITNLTFQWMKIDGPHLDSCNILHPGINCQQEILQKMLKTTKISKKFYVFFHCLPFLLKLKKYIREGKVTKAFFKLLQNYLKSILFIAHLVSGLKLLKCTAVNVLNPLNIRLDGKIFLWGSFLSSIGIFWQQKNRREQITYFAFVRSIRSSYIFLKRNKMISLKNQMRYVFILMFGILSYIYTVFPNTVKSNNILEHFWGSF